MVRSFTIPLFLLFIITGCSPDTVSEEENMSEDIPLNTIDFTINGEEPVAGIRYLSAFTGCGENLSVSFAHWIETSNGTGYGGSAFDMSLTTSGDLLNVYYRDYDEPSSTYYSPFFTALSTFQVEEFEYVDNEMLRIKIKGQIFEQTYNYFEVPEPTELSTEIIIKDFSTCNQDFFPNTIITDYNFVFHKISRVQSSETIFYRAFSNAGHLLEFKNLDERLTNLPEGVYSFEEDSVSPRVNLSEFIGVPRAFVNNIIIDEWKNYETSGSFEIIKVRNSDGETFSQIIFNVLAMENGTIKYEFNNAVFETSW